MSLNWNEPLTTAPKNNYPHLYTKFIKKIRLETAAALLVSSDLPISRIAFQAGLNPIHFAKIFKQEFGKTPTQYKKTN